MVLRIVWSSLDMRLREIEEYMIGYCIQLSVYYGLQSEQLVIEPLLYI